MSKTDVDMATTENAIENPITGTELSNQRQVEKLMRGIQNVLDFSVAERLTDRPEHPDNPWALMKAWRIGDDRFAGWLGWKEKDGDFAFRSHAWGILPLHEDTPLTWVDTKGMSSACPSKGQVTPINTNPYYDMMRCEPLVTQLLYVVKPAKQYGIGADALLVRSIYPPEFDDYNPETETGLAILSERVELTKGGITEDRYSLIEHSYSVDAETGEKRPATRTIPFYVDADNTEVLYSTGNAGRTIVTRAHSRMTGDRYRYVASCEFDGDLINWMDELRSAMWGEEFAKQQIRDAEIKIEASLNYGRASIDLLAGSHVKSA